MVPATLPPGSSSPTFPPHVIAMERIGTMTLYYLAPNLTREQKLVVLAEVRARHAGMLIRMSAHQVAVFTAVGAKP